MASLSLRRVRKEYGTLRIIQDVDLEVADREFISLVGPSGCGKSTLLRMVAGLETVTGGDILIGSERVNDVAPMHRDVAMVFQSYALYPHMTVTGNISFGLRLRRLAAAAIGTAVAGAATVLNLEQLLERRPSQLSGGQRQRVAMGRAMVRQPRLFLFDEPLSNLDAKLRVQMRTEIKSLHRRLASTSLYVTHDQVEAMTMADRIVVMNGGRIEQEGPPETLYDRPASLFVAGFIGSPAMNFLPGTRRGDTVELGHGIRLPLPRAALNRTTLNHATQPGHGAHDTTRDGQPITLGLRPEHLHPLPASETAGFPAEVIEVEPTGVDTLVVARLAGIQVTASLRERFRAPPGTPIRLAVDTDRLHAFDTATGRSLQM